MSSLFILYFIACDILHIIKIMVFVPVIMHIVPCGSVHIVTCPNLVSFHNRNGAKLLYRYHKLPVAWFAGKVIVRFGGETLDKEQIIDILITMFSVFMIDKQLVHVCRE